MLFQDVEDLGFSEWSWASLVIIILFCFLLYELVRRASNKIVLKAYSEIPFNNLDKKPRATKLKRIGEWLDERPNERKRCLEWDMRHNLKKYTLFTKLALSQYFNDHLIDRDYVIQYLLNAQVFEKALPEKEWYKKELGYSIQALFYKAFSFCFDTKIAGLIISAIIGCIASIIAFPDVSWAFLVGMPICLSISVINHLLQINNKISDSLLKKKTKVVKTERFITPLESEYEILDVYKVEGYKLEQVETSDKAKDLRELPLTSEKKKIKNFMKTKLSKKLKIKKSKKSTNIEIPENKIENPKVKIKLYKCPNCDKTYKTENGFNEHKCPIVKKEKEIKEKQKLMSEINKKVKNYVIVEGYDELYKMKLDSLIKITSIEKIGIIERRRTTEEMMMSRRSYLSRNRAMVEENFRLMEQNERLQKEYANLHIEMRHKIEEGDKRVNESGKKWIKDQGKMENTLSKIYSDIYGAKFISEKFEGVHEKVMSRIRMYEKETLLLGIRDLAKSIKDLVIEVGTHGNFDTKRIEKMLELKFGDGGNIT